MTDIPILFDDDWELDGDLIDQASNDLAAALRSGKWLDTREVKLGAPVGAGGAIVVAVSEDDSQFTNEVWFTELDDTWFSTAINSTTRWTPGTHVELGRPPNDPLNWHVRALAFTPEQPSSAFPGVSPHARSHDLIGVGSAGDAENIVKGTAGSDPVILEDRSLWPLGIVPGGGMTIRIGNGHFITAGTRVDFPGWDSPDWTSDIPSTPGRAFWRLIEVDNVGDVSYTDSDEFVPSNIDVNNMIPAGTPSINYQSGAVFFEYGMAAISFNHISSNHGLRAIVPSTATFSTSGWRTFFEDINSRNLDVNFDGGIHELATSQALDSVTPIVVTSGTGKIFLSVSGADVVGSITVSGTSVDRDTMAITIGDSEILAVDGVTTNTSAPDPDGNIVHNCERAYATSKWWRGSVTFSTSDLDLTADLFQVSFFQYSGEADVTIDDFDFKGQPTNGNAWADFYLYAVIVTGSEMDITPIASLNLPASITTANKEERARLGNLGIAIDGGVSGTFVDAHFGPDPNEYWEHNTLTSAYSIGQTIELGDAPPPPAWLMGITGRSEVGETTVFG